MAEWLKALAWKASYRSKAGTRVRIPPAPWSDGRTAGCELRHAKPGTSFPPRCPPGSLSSMSAHSAGLSCAWLRKSWSAPVGPKFGPGRNPAPRVELAARLKRLIDQSEASAVPVGKLDITLYRDDLQMSAPARRRRDAAARSRRAHRVIVETCCTPGARCARRSTSAPTSAGPGGSCSAFLVDRGGRSCRFRRTSWAPRRDRPQDRVDVFVSELDGRDAVELVRG